MKKRVIIWAFAALVAIAAYIAAPVMVESGIPSIYYITPSVKTYENIVSCAGVVQSENIYDVYASAAFVPDCVGVSVGDMVSKGDILLSVDDAATQALRQGSVGGVINGITDEALSAAASFDLNSILAAFGLSGIAGYDLSGVADAVGNSSQPEDNVTAVSSGMDFNEITAPASGIVTAVNVSANSPVAAGKAVFTIQDVKHYKVAASVNEGDITKVQIGDVAIIRGTGFAGTSFKGEVSRIYPTARKAISGTGTDTVVDIEIRIISPNNKLRHGFSAKVEISGGQSQRLVTVPYEAVRQDALNREYVYTYEDGRLKKTPIVTGKELINEVEVLDGLGFDSIVIYNPDDVTGEGAIVNIKGRADIA